ncbi:MAG: CheY-like chemotaxis protein [Paracoccaceae bacterium]|jgi:CheY-like chemotaxis protein
MAQSDKPPFRVLLVEDNDDHALLITESLLLSEMEVTIERACDGAEALARITASRPPDAILLDLNMPGMRCLRPSRPTRICGRSRWWC